MGYRISSPKTEKRFPNAILALLAAGKLDSLRIVGRIENYPNWRPCFQAMASGEIVKAVLRPERENG